MRRFQTNQKPTNLAVTFTKPGLQFCKPTWFARSIPHSGIHPKQFLNEL